MLLCGSEVIAATVGPAYARRVVVQHWWRAGAIGVGAALAIVGSFLPWLQSGAVDRTSYEIFDLIERLGFSPDGPIGWAVRLWPLVPLLFVLSVIVQWSMSIHPVMVAARRALPLLAATYAGGVAFAIRLAPDAGLFRFRYGSWFTLIGALVVVVATLWPIRRRGSDAPAAS